MPSPTTSHFKLRACMSLSKRSAYPREAKRQSTYSFDFAWHPSSPHTDPVHLRLDECNRESYPYALFALADDLLVRAFFGSKATSRRWNDVVPASASHSRLLTSKRAGEDIRAAANACSFLTNTPVSDILAAVTQTAKCLALLPTFNRPEREWLAMLSQ